MSEAKDKRLKNIEDKKKQLIDHIYNTDRQIQSLRIELYDIFAELKKFEITNGWQQHHDCQTGCLNLFLRNVIAQFQKGNYLKYCKIANLKHSIF